MIALTVSGIANDSGNGFWAVITQLAVKRRKFKVTCLRMLLAVAVLLVIGVMVAVVETATAAEQALAVERESLARGRASQERIDTMSEEAARLLQRYREVAARAESLALYNDNLEKITHSQTSEIASLRRQLAGIEETRREIVPFKLRILAALEGFVQRDLPFLAAERQGRLEGLTALMERADVTVAEKFRRGVG